MAQNVVDFSDNPTGAELMDDYLAKDQQNVLTSNSGIQRPSYAVAGTKWLDTSVTPWLWKMYDGTNDVTLGTVNPSTHLFIPAGVLPSQDGQSGKFLQTNGSNTVWSDAVDYTNITNCITKIPQDIKLELNDGVLTLKAGSKVYVPNGVGKFDEVIVQNDISASSPGGIVRNRSFVVYRNNGIQFYIPKDVFSGPTEPTPSGNYAIWYDTTNNYVKYTSDKGVTWNTAQQSFPVCLASSTDTKWTLIDQVFNGFGYIGSTVFALPGVEGLIPKGRNTDGSLNNIKFTTTSVLTRTNPNKYARTFVITLRNDNLLEIFTNAYGYDKDKNINYNTILNEPFEFINAGTYSQDSTGRITSFKPKTTFQATDYYDFKQLDESAAKLDESNVFTGTNTFTQTPFMNTSGNPYGFIAQNNNINVGQTPSASQYIGYDFRGNHGNRLAYIGIEYNVNGGKYLTFQNLNNAYTDTVFTTNVLTNGTLFAADNSKYFAYTSWVNNRITSIMNSGAVGFPNYAAKQILTLNTTGTAPANGWILYTIDMGDVGEFVLYIQEQIVSKAGINYGSDSVGVAFPIKAGWTYRTTSNRNSQVNLYFIPQT